MQIIRLISDALIFACTVFLSKQNRCITVINLLLPTNKPANVLFIYDSIGPDFCYENFLIYC